MKIAVAICAITLVLTSQASAASLFAQANASVGNLSFTQNGSSGPVSISGSNSVGTSEATYSAFTDYGVNKVFAAVSSGQAFDGAAAGSDWIDELVLTTPGDVTGFVTFGISFDAFLTADAQPFRDASASFSYIFSAAGASTAGVISSYGAHQFGRDSVTVAFTSGQAITVRSIVSCGAQAQGLGAPDFRQSRASCNAANSVYWDGVLEVTDAAGNPLTAWSVASTSGTDYRDSFAPQAAVPEPSAWALMIGGFGLAGVGLRRRRVVSALAGT